MEKIHQFVDDIIESRRDDFCAIADDIWDHPETRFEILVRRAVGRRAGSGRFSTKPSRWWNPQCVYRQLWRG